MNLTPSQALDRAQNLARTFRGATSPNPPVGAAALDIEGNLLSVQAHQKAGTLHAEARVLQDCREKGLWEKIHTLVVTLEPCNHHGRTPPCTEGILALPNIRRVLYGVADPNPKVPGRGGERLREGGLEVTCLNDPGCQELIGPFACWVRTGRPWVTIKTAWTAQGSMIPPPGQKTFTSEESLLLAHELRRRADAILTGSGTILADHPEFTVRRVSDHPGKTRWLALLDRRNRVSENWIAGRQAAGMRVFRAQSVEQALDFLGAQGCLEVLVEAGPSLSKAILLSGLWNEHVLITQVPGKPDQVEIKRRKVEQQAG